MFTHPLSRAFARSTAITLAAATFACAALAADTVRIERLWQYPHAQTQVPGQKSEVVAYDRRSDTLWVAGVVGVDVLDRRSGQLVAHLDVGSLGAVNSVALHGGVAALAIESTVDRTLPGVVAFFDSRTRQALGAPVTVGPLPDMLTFTPDGRTVLVANEGTPNARPTAPGLSADDPVGSVSLIDVATRTVTTLPITPSIPGYESLRLFPAAGSRPTQPATYSPYDPEPEYITVDAAGRFAYVTLQEANGLAVLDLTARAFTRILPLGLKDFNVAGNEIDPTDRNQAGQTDGIVEFVRVPVKGLYQPDTIASYRHRGRTYLVMANEGDARDNGSADGEDERRGSTGGSNAAARLVPSTGDWRLFRTTFDNVLSTPDNLVKFGAHSFSIRDTEGRIVFDSGSQLDREAAARGLYDDTRSDNKGVEPEGVALLQIGRRTLAFIGLERTLKSAVAVYDITDPHAVSFIDMIVSEGDLSPEGLTAFRIGSRHFLAVANEVSDTTSLFEIRLGDAPR